MDYLAPQEQCEGWDAAEQFRTNHAIDASFEGLLKITTTQALLCQKLLYSV